MRYYSSDEELDDADSHARYDRLEASSQILNREQAARYGGHHKGSYNKQQDSDKENLRASNLIRHGHEQMGAIQETR